MSLDLGPYRLEESVGYLINRASRAIRRRFNARLHEAGFGITGEQWAVLVHLWERDARPQHELAAILDKDKTTITRLVDDLEAQELVRRVEDPADRRRRLVTLTPRAHQMEAGVKRLAQDVLSEAVDGVADADLRTTKAILRRIFDTLSDAGDAT